MRILDVETHYGVMKGVHRSFLSLSALEEYMKLYGITDAAVYHRAALQDAEHGNEKILELTRESKNLLPVFVVDPPIGSQYLPDADALVRVLSAGAAAVRLFPKNTDWRLHPLYCGELFSVLQEMQIPVFLEEEQCDMALLPLILEAFPRLQLVLLRFGLRQSRYIFPILRKYENVRFGTGFMADVEMLDEYVDKFGAERFIFSAGIPAYDPCGAIAEVCGLDIPESDKEKIFYGNFLEMQKEIKYRRKA